MKKLNDTQYFVFSFIISFLVVVAVCAYFVAPAYLSMGDFRAATLKEKYFWFAVIVIVFLSGVLRYKPWEIRN